MPGFAVIQQDQYTATAAVQCITVIIPDGDEYKALLAGMLQLPANVLNYADPASAQADGVAAAWGDALAQIDWEGCVLPQNEGLQSREQLWSREGIISSGGVMTFTNVTSTWYNGYWHQATPLITDRHDFFTYLSPGTWNGRIMYRKTSGSGIATIKARPDSGSPITIGAVDFYNATTQENQMSNLSFSIVDGGRYVVSVESLSKNASSSGYQLDYALIDLYRTS